MGSIDQPANPVFLDFIGLDIRGNGTARWDGNRITATGNNYTLHIGFSVLSSGNQCTCSSVVVQNGLVTAVDQGPPSMLLPFSLPTVGSSGNFTIQAPVNPVSYDLSSVFTSTATKEL